eukprot:gene3462-1841_t
MNSGKRYFNAQGSFSSKRKPQQPYMVDKRLTPRVKEFIESYTPDSPPDVDEVVDYLQMTFQEYGRKKRGALRQSVVKVLSSSPGVPDKRIKIQSGAFNRSSDGRYSHGKLSPIDLVNDESESSSSEDVEEIIEAKDTNMINNSMQMLYSKNVKDSPVAARPQYNDEEMTPAKHFDIPVAMSMSNTMSENPSEPIDSKKKVIDQIKADNASTPLPSPSRNKGGKSDTERTKQSRNRKREETEIKAKKHAINPTESKLKLADIGGYENALEEVMKLLFHLKHPEVFQRLGVKPPRGFLLHGPPGCGKTLLANAIAGELQLPYYKLAATEIISGVSGESEEKLRELFAVAQSSSPSIIFLDEVDAIAPNRESASKEMERRIVSQLLVCMDDLDQADSDVMLIGATNRPDSLDPALRRAGRFDREICLGIPDKAARKKILEVVCNGLRLSASFDYENIASLTPGFVGADLVSLTREAAMFAVQRIFEKIERKMTSSITNADASQTERELPIDEAATSTTEETRKLNALAWLRGDSTITMEELENFFIESHDFKRALGTVQPSAKREGFATVPDVTWNDIGALEDIRDELTLAILAPVRHYDKFASLGIVSPPGILLAGPPGCGKTLLAKAIANEAGINFISVKGPELLNMYVGESERAVRQVFQRARNSAPCVIFFDEIDALCPKRSGTSESSASSRVVNQLLTEMDGLVARKQVFLMGATNRPDIIDPAILRPGRLDKILYVGLPTPEDRLKILHTVTKLGTHPKLSEDVNLENIAHDPRGERYR